MNKNLTFLSELEEVKKLVLKAWVTCQICGRREEAIWVGQTFDGWWMANGAQWSELFQEWLPDFKQIICSECSTYKVVDKDSGL